MSEQSFARYHEVSPKDSALIRCLGALTAPDRVLSSETELAAYFYDASMETGRPVAVVFPETLDEIRGLLALCREEGLPLIVRGSGTNLSGGTTAPHGGIICQMSRFDRILEVHGPQRRAVAEAFVYNNAVNESAEHLGLHFAPDPSSFRVSTLGGNAAENSGGPHALKYGVTSQHILGMDVVLDDGEIVRFGGRCLERPGPDVMSLFIGSEGTLGIITELTLRLTPRPEHVVTLLAIFDHELKAAAAVSAVIASGIIPSTLEMMDRETIIAVERAMPAGYPPDADAVLLIEVDGVQQAVEEESEIVERVCRECGARSVEATSDPAHRDRLWHGRRASYAALARSATGMMVCDAVVPRDVIPEALARIRAIVDKYGVPMADTFHAGDGNVHPKLLFDAGAPGAFETVLQASTEIMRACVDLGGAITGEHGVGTEKIHAIAWSLDEATRRLNRATKLLFDPREFLNPGKVLLARDAPSAPPRLEPCEDLAEALLESGAEVRDGAASDAVDGLSPELWCAPKTVEGLARVLALCAGVGRSVCVVGARTALSWGRPLHELDVVVSTQHLKAVLEFRPQNLTATFEAGVTLEEMRQTVAQEGLMLRFDPPGACSSTLGGIVATAATGPCRFGLGPVRDGILGVGACLPTGEVASFGGRVMKNVAGYDFTHLMVGARGALAAIGHATLRLIPRPREFAVLRATFPDAATAMETAQDLAVHMLEPLALRVHPIAARLDLVFGSVPKACERLLSDALRRLPSTAEVSTLRGAEAERALADLSEEPPPRTTVACEITVPPTLEAEALRLAEQHVAVVDVRVDSGCGYLLLGLGEADVESLCSLDEELGVHHGSILDVAGPRELRDGFFATRPKAGRLEGLSRIFDPAGVLAPGRLD